MAELKLPKSYIEQIEILKNRGLQFNDETRAQEILSQVNYYRLVSAYSLGLYSQTVEPGKDPTYADGVSFFQLYDLYCFDTKLRQVVSALIEPFELEFKTKLAYYLALKYCSTCYLKPEIFENGRYHESFVQELMREKWQQRSSPIVKHHDMKYNGILPLWAAVEILSFGAVSKMFKNLNIADRSEFSESNYGISESYLTSWLGCFVGVRNICAHYGRLYNKNLVSRAKLFSNDTAINNYKIFSAIFLLYRIVPEPSLKLSLAVRLKEMLTQHKSVDLSKIGFPENWSKILSEVGGIYDVNYENRI